LAQLQSDLSEFVGLLNSYGVEYLVVGGHAVAFHGHPRLTGDIDFFIRPVRENAERVLRVLAEFGFGDLKLNADDLCLGAGLSRLRARFATRWRGRAGGLRAAASLGFGVMLVCVSGSAVAIETFCTPALRLSAAALETMVARRQRLGFVATFRSCSDGGGAC
jgi:hypothetical protein